MVPGHTPFRSASETSRAIQHEHDYHEERLHRRNALRKHKSVRRTSLRVEARKKLKSSSLLRQIGVFKALSPQRLRQVVDAMAYREYEDGCNIILQGQPSRNFFVLVDGRCRVMQVDRRLHDDNGKSKDADPSSSDDFSEATRQRVIGSMVAPTCFGETALLPRATDDTATEPKRRASVQALGSVRVLSLSRDAYQSLLDEGVLEPAGERSTGGGGGGGDGSGEEEEEFAEENLEQTVQWRSQAYERLDQKRALEWSAEGTDAANGETVFVGKDEDAPTNIGAVMQREDAARAQAGLGRVDTETEDEFLAHTVMHEHHERRLTAQIHASQKKAQNMLQARLQARRALRKTALFSGWSGPDVVKVVAAMERRSFSNGTKIFVQGDVSEEFMILLEGSVRVHQSDPAATGEAHPVPADVDLCTLGEWDSLGETALTENACRTASCTATSHVEALVLSKSVFAALMRDQETTGSALATSAGKRMSDLTGKDKARHEAAKQAVLAGGAPEPPPQGETALRVAQGGGDDCGDDGGGGNSYGWDSDDDDGAAKVGREKSFEVLKVETKDDGKEEVHGDTSPTFI